MKPNSPILFVLLFVVASPAFASEAGFWSGFTTYISGVLDNIWYFFSHSIPDAIDRFIAWGIEYAVYIKLYLFYNSVLHAYSIAQHLSANLHLSEYLTAAVSGLPGPVQAVGRMWGIPDCINFLVNCWLTRFVMTFMGW